jgi:glutathione S-transferase
MDILYAASGSTSLVAAILLEECEHPYTLETMELYSDGAGGANYAKTNPWRQVPALSTDRGLVTEVIAIAEYLDQKYPARSLWPKDGWQRVQALRWYSQLSTAIQPYIQCIVRPERFIGTSPDGCRLVREHVARLIVGKLALVEAELRQRDWLAGDDFGPADALLSSMLGWVQLMRLPIAPLGQLRAHALRCRARPAVVRAIERHGTTPSIVRKTSAEALLGVATAARAE